MLVSSMGDRSQYDSDEETTQISHDDEGFQSWWSGQTQIKKNIKQVCDEYGQTLNFEVPLSHFMYESNNKLLFCRNPKVQNKIFFYELT